MRVLFALIVCSHVATLAAAGVLRETPVGLDQSAWLVGALHGVDDNRAISTLDFDETMHLTIGHGDVTRAASTPAVPAKPMPTGMIFEASTLDSFDIATFNDPASQAAAPVVFTTASAIPAPASLLLIVLGGLIALRR